MSMPSSPDLAQATRWHLERRLREVAITPELIFRIVKEGVPRPFAVLAGLPPDAALIEPGFDPFSGYFILLVASAEFSPVPKAERIPTIDVTFRTVER